MYRLTGRLEAGDLAELYRADRLADGSSGAQPVVIKLLHQKTSDAQYARAAAGTAKQLTAVNAPGVARILEVGSVKGRLAIVREDFGRYTLGQVLRRLYTREVFLPSTYAIALVIELLELLHLAHAQGVVHGALTPGNVLVADDARPGLADFGALDWLQASSALKKTFANRGRSSYRAPELKGAEPGTVAADVFACGAITYELLTLHEPSTGSASVSTRNERLPPPSRLVRKLNSRIDPIVMRALESSPVRRQKTCADFAASLREFVGASGGLPSRDALRKFVDELFPKDAVLDGLGPVPFSEAFSLEDLGGVRVLPEELEVAEVSTRQAFSGGKIDEKTPTVDGMPAVLPEEQPEDSVSKTTPLAHQGPSTQPELEPVAAAAKETIKVPAVSDTQGPPLGDETGPMVWDAPPSVVAPKLPSEDKPITAGGLKRRMRPLTSFDTDLPRKEGESPRGPRPSSPEKPKQTQVNYVTSFQRTDVPGWVDLEPYREEARRRARVAAGWSTFILSAFVLFVAGYWYMTSVDMVGDLVRYLPGPIQVAINEHRHHELYEDMPRGRPLHLRDFDKIHPVKLVGKRKAVAPPKPPQVVADPTPVPQAGCYLPPTGGSIGALWIAAPKGARVELDGKKLCGGSDKVLVPAGLHQVRVLDATGRLEYVATPRVVAGKTAKIVPVFGSR